jgi:hypothetical protein
LTLFFTIFTIHHRWHSFWSYDERQSSLDGDCG